MRLYILIIILSFYCCTSKSHLLKNNTQSLPLIVMERTACYGTCPQYIISIYNNGTIEYEGKMFVSKIGCFFSFLSEDILNMIKSEFIASQFFSFENEYNSNITDIPSVILEAHMGSKNHRVIDRLNGPKKLKNLQNLIDSVGSTVIDWQDCQN